MSNTAGRFQSWSALTGSKLWLGDLVLQASCETPPAALNTTDVHDQVAVSQLIQLHILDRTPLGT
jgi:hypothetical protein